jgi:hypothetical protein
LVVARIAWPARSPSGNRIEREYLRVAIPISIWLNAQRDSKSAAAPPVRVPFVALATKLSGLRRSTPASLFQQRQGHSECRTAVIV